MIRLHRPVCPHPIALEAENYKHHLNKSALASASNDKCMYCESKISHIDFAHIEHIKPKAERAYPELAYNWDNLGYACPKCNNTKSDKYHEATPYIDPYAEEPSAEIFASGAFLFQRNGSERGEITIRDVGLNRPDLLEKRLARIEEIGKALSAAHRTHNEALKEAALEEIERESQSDKEYSLCVRAFLQANENA